jgi:hypothetical protein
MNVNPRLAAAFASAGVAPRPETTQNVAQPPAQAAPQPILPKIVQVPDAALMDANANDDEARRQRGLEAAARHLIAGFTRTPLAPTLSEGPTAVDKLLAARQLQRKNDFEAQHYGNEDQRLSNEAMRLALEDKRLGMQGAPKVDPLLEQKKVGLELDNKTKEKKLNAPPPTPKAAKTPGLSKDGTELRKEFNQLPEVKEFTHVTTSFGKIRSAAANPSAAGDLNLITEYMKMLDPNSSVREGEFLNAQNAAGLPQTLVAKYNKVVSGERLAPEQRADFLKQAGDLYRAHQERYDVAVKRYRDLASRANANPDDVIGAITAQPSAAPTQQPAAQLTPEDEQAIAWAKANPNDPDAQKILKLHGM